jgi:hypothetical protein
MPSSLARQNALWIPVAALALMTISACNSSSGSSSNVVGTGYDTSVKPVYPAGATYNQPGGAGSTDVDLTASRYHDAGSDGTIVRTANGQYLNQGTGGYLVPVSNQPGVYTDTAVGGIITQQTGGWWDSGSGGWITESTYSVSDTSTKDVDLQSAELEQESVNERAQAFASQFDVEMDASVQLTQLSDRVHSLLQQGEMTEADRQAVIQASFDVAGVSTDEVNDAIKSSLNGDNRASEAVMEKAAKNLGMPSADSLRDKLLPALGFGSP